MGIEDFAKLVAHYAQGGMVHPAHEAWLSEMFTKQKYAQGGMVNAYNPKNGILKGGLNIINPKNTVRGPLDIQYNQNNMVAANKAQQRKQYGH